ncbi:unnamed protein product [Ectocarpus fasciculatus]
MLPAFCFGGARASRPNPRPSLLFRHRGTTLPPVSPQRPEAHTHRSKIYVVDSRASRFWNSSISMDHGERWHPFERLVLPVENHDTGAKKSAWYIVTGRGQAQ